MYKKIILIVLYWALFLNSGAVYSMGEIPTLLTLGMSRQAVEHIFGFPLIFQTHAESTHGSEHAGNIMSYTFYRSSLSLEEYPRYIFAIFLNNHLMRVIGFYDLYDYQRLTLKLSENSAFISVMCKDFVSYENQKDNSYYIFQRIDDLVDNFFMIPEIQKQILQLMNTESLYMIFYHDDMVFHSLYEAIQNIRSFHTLFPPLEKHILRTDKSKQKLLKMAMVYRLRERE